MNLNQITVPSLDLTITIPFYEKLGLKLIVASSADYARFECPEGNASFSIHRVDSLPMGDGVWVYFEIKNLDETVKQLQQNGIVFDELPTDKPWLWREARLKDPDGNRLILYFAGENRLNPPWKIQEKDSHTNLERTSKTII